MIARAHCQLNQPAQAANQLEPHLPRAKLEPERHADFLLVYAQAQIALGRVDVAANLWIPLCSESARWRYNAMSLTLEMNSSLASTINWLDRVSMTLPADEVSERTRLAAIWLDMASRHKSADCRQRAGRLLETLTASSSHASADLWFLMGMLREQESDVIRAQQAYRQALSRSPNMSAAGNNLAMLLVDDIDKIDEALKLISQAVQLNPQSAVYLDTLAHIQNKMQRHEEAVASARQAVALQPDNPQWRTRLASLLQSQEQQNPNR
jgi:tetratricopeptide (TPR) repeat protein